MNMAFTSPSADLSTVALKRACDLQEERFLDNNVSRSIGEVFCGSSVLGRSSVAILQVVGG